MRYFIEFSYKGTAYHGWQSQPNAKTVQEVLENAMTLIMNKNINLTAAGRTDAGVHAEQMFAHFDYEFNLEENIVYKLNSFLPIDIAVIDIVEVMDEAHARFDAVSRTYIYKISTKKNPFAENLAYDFHLPLNLNNMRKASSLLLEYKDFQCFSKSKTDVKTYNCEITRAEWEEAEDVLKFTITADRFLRNMVRAIVGTLIVIGSEKLEANDLKKIIKSKNRSEAGYSVPAHGLYLQKITYPDSVFK